MAVTPNYSWPVPVNTDYVKDGAEAIKDLGDAIDATVFGLPAPASGLTLLGTFTMSGTATTTSVNNIFSATYTNYKIIGYAKIASGTGNAFIKLRVSGVDSSASYYSLYNYVAIDVSSVGTTKASNSASGIILGNFSTEDTFFQFDIIRPNAAALTGFTGSYSQRYGANFYVSTNGGVHDVSLAYDGLTLTCATNLTGAFSVYGYQI